VYSGSSSPPSEIGKTGESIVRKARVVPSGHVAARFDHPDALAIERKVAALAEGNGRVPSIRIGPRVGFPSSRGAWADLDETIPQRNSDHSSAGLRNVLVRACGPS